MNFSNLLRRTITLSLPSPNVVNADEPLVNALTLADVVLLKVPLSWHEAVGLVLELLDRAPAQGALPDPAHVTLSAIGEVRPTSKATLSGVPVARAARLLQELISDASAPGALRDLIAQDSAAKPVHTSLSEFARALSYFERPNRRADVAAVYTRAHALFEKANSEKELERLRAKAVQDQRPEPTRVRLLWQLPRPAQVFHALLVVALCSVIAVSSFALVRVAVTPAVPRTDAPGPDVEAPLIAKSPAALADAATNPSLLVEAASTQVRQLIDRGLAAAGVSSSAQPAPDESAAPAAPTKAPRKPATQLSRPRMASSASSIARISAPAARMAPAAAPPSEASDARPPEARGQWTVSVQEVTSPAGLAEFVSIAAPDSSDDASPVYSRADAEVEPAVLVRPQMPSVPEEFGAQAHPSVFDLLIDPSGHVEQVRLVSPTNRFSDRILVSAAKAWQFQPASLDGQPVRYRLRLRITP